MVERLFFAFELLLRPAATKKRWEFHGEKFERFVTKFSFAPVLKIGNFSDIGDTFFGARICSSFACFLKDTRKTNRAF